MAFVSESFVALLPLRAQLVAQRKDEIQVDGEGEAWTLNAH